MSQGDPLDTCRKAIEAALAAKGYKPGWYQWEWRNGTPVKEAEYNDCMLAVLDALINQGSVAAWAGDGTSCVVQMILQAYKERDEWKARALVLENGTKSTCSHWAEKLVTTNDSGVYICEICERVRKVPYKSKV